MAPKVIGQAIKSYFLQEGHEADWREIAPPDLTGSETPYGITVNKLNLDIYERVSLALVLAPQFKPEVLDIFMVETDYMTGCIQSLAE